MIFEIPVVDVATCTSSSRGVLSFSYKLNSIRFGMHKFEFNGTGKPFPTLVSMQLFFLLL